MPDTLALPCCLYFNAQRLARRYCCTITSPTHTLAQYSSSDEPAVEQLKRPRPPPPHYSGTGAAPPTALLSLPSTIPLLTLNQPLPPSALLTTISLDSRHPHLVPILPGMLLRRLTHPHSLLTAKNLQLSRPLKRFYVLPVFVLQNTYK